LISRPPAWSLWNHCPQGRDPENKRGHVCILQRMAPSVGSTSLSSAPVGTLLYRTPLVQTMPRITETAPAIREDHRGGVFGGRLVLMFPRRHRATPLAGAKQQAGPSRASCPDAGTARQEIGRDLWPPMSMRRQTEQENETVPASRRTPGP
jgi:hypothetical protein